MQNDVAGATELLNGIKNIAEFEYLFNTEDLPESALKAFASLTNVNPEVREFVTKAAKL